MYLWAPSDDHDNSDRDGEIGFAQMNQNSITQLNACNDDDHNNSDGENLLCLNFNYHDETAWNSKIFFCITCTPSDDHDNSDCDGETHFAQMNQKDLAWWWCLK